MNKEITLKLREITRLLLEIDSSELEEHIKACNKSLSDMVSFGSVIRPADYFTAQQNGTLDFARLQNEMVQHIAEAKKLADKMPLGNKILLMGGGLYDGDGNDLLSGLDQLEENDED